ncbi:methionyl aminopeptidase [Schizopora paradoxa]|uniref:Methionine aminopeptidase n=1 Tax=Schizopora paradoxa TaxID=27342 RepID=A0A0H2RRC9_9AGAM|nr:methionyl aminopeptidase [Schizopora paradoxa]
MARQLKPSVDREEDEDFGEYDIILPPDEPVWGVDHILPRSVPSGIIRPLYAALNRPGPLDSSHDERARSGDGRIDIRSEVVSKLRRAGALAKEVLRDAEGLVKPGVTTNAIDKHIHEFIISKKAYPSPLHYSDFPRSCCTSVNNIVVHGIPDDRSLKDGDIVNIDVTVYLDGFHGDTSRTFLVGNVDIEGRKLVTATEIALQAGIKACKPGAHFKFIGAAIQAVADLHGYSVSTQFSGHGIGSVFHRSPWILHHRNDEPGTMLPGHCFTIEPCLVQGSDPRAWIFPDGWTASTTNGARSAQAEHTILITEDGVEVLTQ